MELREGVAESMAPERLGHSLTKRAAVNALAAAIRNAGTSCEAAPHDVGVRISARTMHQPDALVYGGPRLPSDTRGLPAPVIVVEAPPPSTAVYDQRAKPATDLSRPGLRHDYIL